MQLLIVFVVVVLVLLFGIVVASDLDESDRPVAFEVKVAVSDEASDEASDGESTGGMSPRRVHGRRHGRRGARRRKAGVGEVSHYAKMHSRTRYRI